MDEIGEWREKIDELDRKLVALLNERAQAARSIGRLKAKTKMRVYEPDREKVIFDNIARTNSGPLSESDLKQIYERIIDIMRNIQKIEIGGEPAQVSDSTERDLND